MRGTSFVAKAANNTEDNPTTKLRILSELFLIDLRLFNADCCYHKNEGYASFEKVNDSNDLSSPFIS